MNLTDARELATALIGRHGLAGWKLVFDDAKTRAGVCRHGRREIGLSRPLTRLATVEQVTDTVLHEIAHALAGPAHGHDRVWRATALRIGCSGTRCVPPDGPRVDGDWAGTCPAGHRTTAHRRPVRVRSCPECSPAFDLSALYTWAHRGRPAPMHPAYLAELERLRQPGAAAGPAAGAPAVLRVGERVRLRGGGKYGGMVGTIVKRGRTRYHVETASGVLGAPFAMVEPA